MFSVPSNKGTEPKRQDELLKTICRPTVGGGRVAPPTHCSQISIQSDYSLEPTLLVTDRCRLLKMACHVILVEADCICDDTKIVAAPVVTKLTQKSTPIRIGRLE